MTACVASCFSQATRPSAPPKPPIRVRTGCVLGFVVRPASEIVTSKRGSAASRRVSSEASVVPPRMRTRIEAISMNAEAATCTPKRWLSIVGIGEDGVEGLSSIARRLIESAELVVGGARHLELAGDLIRGRRLAWPSPMSDAFAEVKRCRGRSVAILASGDPFHFGVGKQLAAFVAAEEFVCLRKPSAFSLAAAMMGWSLQDVALVTLHGRALQGIIRYLQPGARILALSWDGATPAKLAELLNARRMEQSRITVLEAMGGPRERIRHAKAANFEIEEIVALNTVAIEMIAEPEATILALAPGLDDTFFEHDGQLTKREIRAVTLSSLAPRQGELLWDVGLAPGPSASGGCRRR